VDILCVVRSAKVCSHNEGMFIISVSYVFSEEDRYNSYSHMVLKYFMAEGVLCGHELFLASAQDQPDDILQVSITQGQSAKICHFLLLYAP